MVESDLNMWRSPEELLESGLHYANMHVPYVGVIMGSDSDLPVMCAACEILEKFGVTYECTIVSAHRTPQRLVEYARSARSRGCA